MPAPTTPPPRSILLLDTWKLYFDPSGARSPDQLPRNWRDAATAVTIPHVWEQLRPGYDGVGWYRRALQVTSADLAAGGAWRVRFSAVNYRADVFLNGHFLTRHDSGYTPFLADLTSCLRAGENELLVRVVDPPRDRSVEGLQSSHPLRQTALPTGKAGWYYTFGGMWQPAHLIRTGPVWLEDAFIQPRLAPRSIRVGCALSAFSGNTPPLTLRHTVTRWRDQTPLASGETPVASASPALEIPLPADAPLWSCATPNLLALHLELCNADGAVLDRRSWRFGLREFTTDGSRFLLNGAPIHLRGVLHQGGFPRTLVFPHDDAMARKDIRAILDAGCNLSRITLRPASPAELDLCDELGLMVIAEPPIGWIAHDDEIDRRCLNEVREMILRDRNRPSVVMWTLLNEFSDTVYFRRKNPAALIKAACELGARLDPTRLMTANSGRGMGANVQGNGIFGQGRPPVPILDEHIYLRNFPSAAELDRRIVSLGKNERGLLFVSEFGTSGFPDMDRVLANYTPEERALVLEDYAQMKNYRDEIAGGWRDFNLRRHFPVLADFFRALARDQAEMVRLEQRALRLNPRVAGYVITQGADASSEFGGIVDLWREPKLVYDVYRSLNRDRVLLLDTPGLHFAAGARVPLRVIVSDVTGAPSACKGRVELVFENRIQWTADFAGDSGRGASLLETAITPDRPGQWTLRATAGCGGVEIRDEVTLAAIAAPDFAGRRILLMDSGVTPHGNEPSELALALGRLGLGTAKFANQDNAPGLPVVVHLRGRDRALNYFENQKVLRREVGAGRNAVFIDCDLACMHYFFGTGTPREIYGNGAFAGNMGFGFSPEIFPHAGPDFQIGPAYGACYPRIHPEARDVLATGAEILALHAMPGQFGRPDKIEWGATLYTMRHGRGRVWVCAFRLFEAMQTGDPIALDLFARLLRAAQNEI
jgi:hypothetical protein